MLCSDALFSSALLSYRPVSRTLPAIQMYYVPVGSTQSHSVRFNLDFPLNDGKWHQIMIAVHQTTATLHVDGHVLRTETLSGNASDCTLASVDARQCPIFTGRRSTSGALTTSLAFQGVVRSLDMRLRTALSVAPAVASGNGGLGSGGVVVVHPLDSTRFVPSGHVNGSMGANNSIILDGGVAVVSTVAHVHGTAFTVATVVQLTPGSPGGYLFCKSDASGSIRYYSLYVSASRFITLYYKAQGLRQTQRVSFGQVHSVGDGASHRVVLAITGMQASLFVDDRVRRSAVLADVIDGCKCTRHTTVVEYRALFVCCCSGHHDITVVDGRVLVACC